MPAVNETNLKRSTTPRSEYVESHWVFVDLIILLFVVNMQYICYKLRYLPIFFWQWRCGSSTTVPGEAEKLCQFLQPQTYSRLQNIDPLECFPQRIRQCTDGFMFDTTSPRTLLDAAIELVLDPIQKLQIYLQVAQACKHLHDGGFLACSLLAKQIFVRIEENESIQVIVR